LEEEREKICYELKHSQAVHHSYVKRKTTER
jgi:hypothetical protein